MDDRLLVPPLLAVEVLSPTSFERDAVTKRRDYARAGLEHYWVLDPDTPAVVAYRRRGRALEEVARAAGEEPLALSDPFPIEVVPARLVRPAG